MKNLFGLSLMIVTWQLLSGQGVGIGTTTPNAPLQFANDVQNRKIVLYETLDNDHQYFGFGINGAMLRYQTDYPHSDHAFFSGITDSTSLELMRIKGNGKVGIGTATPDAQLELGSTLANRKIILYEGSVNDHQFFGFGINAGLMRYQVADFSNDHVFYAAVNGATSNELMRIKGDGNVGIGNDPTNMLDVGTGRTGTHSTGRPLYVTGTEFTEFTDPIIEARSIDGARGISIAWNSIFPTGTVADQPFTIKSKGAAGLYFETNGTEKMRIAASGVVGIGMANYNIQNWLDVNAFTSTRTGTHATGLTMYVTGNFGSASTGVEFRHRDGTQGIGFGYNTIYAAGSNTNQDLSLAAKGASGNLTFFTNSLERLKMTGSGNLGLGVTDPLNTLDIHRGTARSNTHPGGSALYVTGNGEFRSTDATVGLRILSNAITSSGNNTDVDLSLATKGAGNILFSTNNNLERMRITPLGVGIGMTTPHAPLHFANLTQNRKIVLFEAANDEHQFYGFGVNGNTLRYQTDQAASDHVFYSAIDGFTSKELMRIKGSGNVGIGTSIANAPLQFSTTSANRKIVLYDINNNDHQFIGLGHNVTSLRYQVNASTSDHIFYAGATSSTSTELMRIEGTGDIGVGLAAPSNKMDIAGATRTNTHPSGRPLYVTGSFLANSNGVEFRHSDAAQGIGIGYNTVYAAGSVANQDIALESKATGAVRFVTNGSERMRVSGTGKVGIGTTTPNGALQFSQTFENRKIVLYEGVNNEHEYTGFGTQANGILRYQISNVVHDHIFYAATSSSASNELMRIKGSGFVGIGTPTPHAPLQFNNTVQNRKIVLAEHVDDNHQFAGLGIGGDLSMRYQTPLEWTEHQFYTGAGNASIELMRVGNIDGLVVNVGTTLGYATVNQNLTVHGSIIANGGILNEAFTAPTLMNSFTNYQNGYANAGYYKDKEGRVCLRGLVQNAGNPTNLVIFNLPAGYRPTNSGRLMFPVINNSSMGRVDVTTTGDVIVVLGSSGWVSLDGITFRAD